MKAAVQILPRFQISMFNLFCMYSPRFQSQRSSDKWDLLSEFALRLKLGYFQDSEASRVGVNVANKSINFEEPLHTVKSTAVMEVQKKITSWTQVFMKYEIYPDGALLTAFRARLIKLASPQELSSTSWESFSSSSALHLPLRDTCFQGCLKSPKTRESTFFPLRAKMQRWLRAKD